METNEVWSNQQEFINNYSKRTLLNGGIVLNDFNELSHAIRKDRSYMNIADLGCWTGLTTAYWGNIAKMNQGKVVAVDDFSGRSEEDFIDLANTFNIPEIFERNMKQMKLEEIVKLKIGHVVDVAGDYTDNYFDIIFVDATYEYNGMKALLDAWYPKLKKGGLMCGFNADVIVDEEFKANYPDKDMNYFIKYFRGVDVAVGEKFVKGVSTTTGSLWKWRNK